MCVGGVISPKGYSIKRRIKTIGESGQTLKIPVRKDIPLKEGLRPCIIPIYFPIWQDSGLLYE